MTHTMKMLYFSSIFSPKTFKNDLMSDYVRVPFLIIRSTVEFDFETVSDVIFVV